MCPRVCLRVFLQIHKGKFHVLTRKPLYTKIWMCIFVCIVFVLFCIHFRIHIKYKVYALVLIENPQASNISIHRIYKYECACVYAYVWVTFCVFMSLRVLPSMNVETFIHWILLAVISMGLFAWMNGTLSHAVFWPQIHVKNESEKGERYFKQY